MLGLPTLGLPLSREGWNPSALFASGEQGAWYDPSDLSTLYQDYAGTTPVTALGQPVGLMLDKRLGLVRGPELIGNVGGPFTATTGWAAAGPSTPPAVTLDSGELVVSPDVSGDVLFFGPISIEAGKMYKVEIRMRSSAPLAVSPRLRDATATIDKANTNVGFSASTTLNTHTGFLIATDTLANATFVLRFGSAGTARVSRVTVAELLGNHASQLTSAARPTLQADANGRKYLQFDGVDDSLWAYVSMTSFPLLMVAGGKADADTVGALVSVYGGAPPYYDIGKSAQPNKWAAYTREAVLRGSDETVGTNAAPHVFAGLYLPDSVNLRMDGTDAVSAATFTAVPFGTTTSIQIGSGGVGLLKGRFYAGIIRNALFTQAQIEAAERFVNSKTGAY